MEKSFCRRLKENVDIVVEIGKFTKLKEAGVFHTGKCPQCSGINFSVSRHKQIYYCFDCQNGGDVIDLIIRKYNISPVYAGNYLAEIYNIPLYDPTLEAFVMCDERPECLEKEIPRHPVNVYQHTLLLLEKTEAKTGKSKESILHAALVMYYKKKLRE